MSFRSMCDVSIYCAVLICCFYCQFPHLRDAVFPLPSFMKDVFRACFLTLFTGVVDVCVCVGGGFGLVFNIC